MARTTVAFAHKLCSLISVLGVTACLVSNDFEEASPCEAGVQAFCACAEAAGSGCEASQREILYGACEDPGFTLIFECFDANRSQVPSECSRVASACYFNCGDSAGGAQFIPRAWRCDNEVDCGNGSDEAGCPQPW